MTSDTAFENWRRCLEEARGGSPEALGRLLDEYRPYLLHLARHEMEAELQAKFGSSDLVQDSLLDAFDGFGQFRGERPEDLRAWLRQILLNQLANWRRHFRDTAKRDLGREVPLSPVWQSGGANDGLADSALSPSDKVIQDEQRQLVEAALARLPEHYRQIVIWRSLEQRPFEEIARLLDRSPDAARMLWGRAVEALQRELGASE